MMISALTSLPRRWGCRFSSLSTIRSDPPASRRIGSRRPWSSSASPMRRRQVFQLVPDGTPVLPDGQHVHIVAAAELNLPEGFAFQRRARAPPRPPTSRVRGPTSHSFQPVGGCFPDPGRSGRLRSSGGVKSSRSSARSSSSGLGMRTTWPLLRTMATTVRPGFWPRPLAPSDASGQRRSGQHQRHAHAPLEIIHIGQRRARFFLVQ